MIGELRGLLVVSLAAGSHTAALQWKAESTHGSVPWYVLNGIGGFFQASFEHTTSLATGKYWTSCEARPSHGAAIPRFSVAAIRPTLRL